jgi:hypothetical protein
MIIGLTGNKYHGKDTVADIIIKEKNYERLSFASPIKQTLNTILCLPNEYTCDPKLKETPLPMWDNKTPRQLMQELGDNFKKLYGNDIFIKNMNLRLIGRDKPVIITDVRFDDEAKIIQERGGYIIKVDSTERLGENKDSHNSEKGISADLIDYVIYNNLGKKELFSEVMKCYHRFFPLENTFP